MSILKSEGDRLDHNTTEAGMYDNFSMCLWVRVNVDGVRDAVFEMRGGGGFGISFIQQFAGNLTVDVNGGTPTDLNSGFIMADGEWNFVAYTKAGAASTHDIYVAAFDDAALTNVTNGASGGSSTISQFMIGSSDFNSSAESRQFAGFKIWNGVELTAEEVEAERWSLTPRRTAGLYFWDPFTASAMAGMKDYSGNGRVWDDTTGIAVDGEMPPVSWRPSRTGKIFLPVAAGPAGQSRSPVAVVGDWVVPAVTVTRGAVSRAPTAVVGDWVVPAVTVTKGAVSRSPEAAVANWVVPAVTVTKGAVSRSPAAVVGNWVVPAVTTVQPALPQSRSPVAVVGDWVVPAVTTVQPALPQSRSPVAVVANWVVPAVTTVQPAGPQSTSPVAVVGNWVVPAVTVVLEVSRSPAAVVGNWVVPAVTVVLEVSRSPAAVVGDWVVPAITLVYDQEVLPVAVVGNWVVPAVVADIPGIFEDGLNDDSRWKAPTRGLTWKS